MRGSYHHHLGTSRLLIVGALACTGFGAMIWLGFSAEQNKEQSRRPQHPDPRASGPLLTHYAVGATAPKERSRPHLLNWYLGKCANLSRHRPTDASLQRTADKLAAFATTGHVGEIRGISRDEIGRFVDFVIEEFDRSAIEEFSWSAARLPAEIIPVRKPSLKRFLSGWFEAIQGPEASPAASMSSADSRGRNASVQSNATDLARDNGEITRSQGQDSQESVALPPVDLGFASEVDEHGQVLSTGASFREGTSTIYGVFENKGAVAGLSHVLAIWRYEASNVSFQECEPIHASTRANYVWLSPNDGWPRGSYVLEIFDPNDSFTIVGRGQFTVE